MDPRVAVLARAHGGVVVHADLSRLDIDPRQVGRWVRDGLLVRLRRGAYVDATTWTSADRDRRYRLRVVAALRSRGRGELATHHSALAMWDLPLWSVRRDLVVLASDVQETTTISGVRLMPLRRLAAVSEVHGLAALALPDAVVTTASVSPEAAVVAGDAALHAGRCTLADVLEAAERLGPTLRGRRRLRRALEALDPACESVGESRTRMVLDALGLPFRSQAVIRERTGAVVARVDFLVAERVVVEFDGAVKYAGDDGAATLMLEKRREDRLRELGYAVVRVTWADLADPALILARIRRAFTRQAA